MRGVLSSEPTAVVLVGEAAVRELTRSTIGTELLLRVYQSAFARAARQQRYHIDAMASGIVSTFEGRSEAAGGGFIDLLLSDFPRGAPGPTGQPHRPSRAPGAYGHLRNRAAIASRCPVCFGRKVFPSERIYSKAG